MPSFRRSLLISVTQRYSELALRLVATLALARLLTPAEIGAFVVVASAGTIATVLCDFGVQTYLVQERELTAERREAASGLTWATSLAFAALFVAGGLVAARIESTRPLGGLLLVYALTLATTPLSWPSTGLLQRDMRFAALYAVGTARAATFAATAIALAALGAGPLALVWACLAENLVAGAICLATAGAPPRPRIAFAAWRSIARFGAFATANSVIRQTGDAAPGLAAGHTLGLGAAGLLTRAQTLLGLFDKLVVQGVGPVMLPYLSDRARRGADLAPAYLAKLAILGAVAWPAFGVVALTAGSIVRVLLGPQWDDAVPLVRLLCLSGLVLPFNAMNISFFIALGLLPVFTRRQAAVQLIKVLMVVAAAFIGLPAMAVAIVVADLARFVIVQSLLARHVRYVGSALAEVLMRSAAVTAFALAPAILVLLFADPATPLARVVVVGLVVAAGWLAGVLVMRHPLRDEIMNVRERLAGRARPRIVPPRMPAED